MAIYNVAVQVLALVEADSEDEAIAKLRARIEAKGLVARDDEGNAFLSEPGVEADF